MKPRIAIFQKDLRVGGIQRSLINLLNSIDIESYDIDLYLFSTDNFYESEFPKGINVIYKKSQSRAARFVPFGLYYTFKKVDIDRSYDIAIDYDGYQAITATYALRTRAKKHLYWVHNDLYIRHTVQDTNVLKVIYYILRATTRSKWRKFDKFVGVSTGVLGGFRDDFPSKEFIVIPNTINVDEIILKSSEPLSDFVVDETKLNLLALGRLEHQKGIDLLIPQVSKLLEKRNDLHLYIIGDGSLRKSLLRQVEEAGLGKTITFLGAKKNPFKYLVLMDGLVLYSRYEGQGMVLMEAKALGLPYYFPKHLEKYNAGLTGVSDIVDTLLTAKKLTGRKIDRLEEYNASIIRKINETLRGA